VFDIEVINRSSAVAVAAPRLEAAVTAVLQAEGVAAATVSVAVVDDATIRELNRRFLEHDYATDVLSFELERRGDYLEGEVVVSAETALRQASRYGWGEGDELLLYVIHGTLHLIGYDDLTRDDRVRMRAKEQRYLAALGCAPCHDDGDDVGCENDL
jgi:probable rRNA maturation factor